MNPARFLPRALASARHAAGLSTYELARRMNVSRQQVTSWENGRWVPTPPRLVALAGALNVDPLRLMLEPGEPPALAELRVATRGFTQGQLAAELDMPRSTYSVIERGGFTPTLNPDLRDRLAAALDLDPATIESAYAEGIRLFPSN